MSEVNFEDRARQDGWRPQEEWTGDPAKWVDAETFVKRGEQIHSFQRGKISRLEDRVQAQEREIQEIREFRERELERVKAEKDSRIRELESQRAQAIENGDGAAFSMADREINTLREPEPARAPRDADEQTFQRYMREWGEENTWYGSDEAMTGYADGVANRIVQDGFTGPAFFTELERRVKREFSDRFQSSAGVPDVGVPGNQGTAPGSSGKGYDDLPPEDREACDRQCNSLGIDRDVWLANYDWED